MTVTEPREQPVVMTIGHSTHPAEEFVALLRAHGVRHLVDIRTLPRSRHNPQFNRDELEKALPQAGIAYTHLKELGGLRHPRADSPNGGWRNASFRGYADYMQTAEFEAGVGRLLQIAAGEQCAVMCAEAVPWRCHRSLLADALLARGVAVEHISSARKTHPHVMTPFARVEGRRVTYPPSKRAAKRRPAARKAAESPQLGLQYAAKEASKMAARKRKPQFTAAKEAKRRARLAAGAPPAERVIADKRRKPQKHKKPIKDAEF